MPTLNSKPSWSVLYYGGGTNNLQQSVRHAWAKLEDSELPSNVDTFVHHFDEKGHLQEAQFPAEGPPILAKVSDEVVNSGEESVFLNFLREGMKKCPADRYIVIVSSHGDGANGVVQDDVSHDGLSLPEIRRTLQEAKGANDGNPVDILMFDACRMASAEMAIQLSGAAGIMLASLDNVGRSGYDLQKLINEASQTDDPVDLAKRLVNNEAHQQQEAFRTLTAVDLNRLEPFQEAWQAWSTEIGSLNEGGLEKLQEFAKTSRRSINAPETQHGFDSIAEDLLAQYPVDEGLFKIWLRGTKAGPGVSFSSLLQKIVAEPELASLKSSSLELLKTHNEALIASRSADDDPEGAALTLHFPLNNEPGALYSEKDGALENLRQTGWEVAYNRIINDGEEIKAEPTQLEKELAPFLPKTPS